MACRSFGGTVQAPEGFWACDLGFLVGARGIEPLASSASRIPRAQVAGLGWGSRHVLKR